MQRLASSSSIRARLLGNLVSGQPRPSKLACSYWATFSKRTIHHYHHSYSSNPNDFDATAATFAPQLTCPKRFYWSSTGVTSEPTDSDTDAPPTSPLPPLTPSNISTTSLIASSTLNSLTSLPECQSFLDLLNGSSINNNGGIFEPTDAQIKEAHSNLKRARDILQSMPELEAATHVIEADLLYLCGKFDLALEGILRYEHHPHTKTAMNHDQRTQLQFMKAKLLVHLGKFSHALSEYEDLLEVMEREVERQVQRQQEQKSKEGNRLPVIHGAAALNGVGVTKLLIHLQEETTGDGDKDEIIESMETAVDLLLESRKEATASLQHARLAIDLGIASCISLTNLGVAHCLLDEDSNQSIECWKRGLETLDAILYDSTHSVTVIPRHKYQCMESVRARLYCNISWALLGFDSLHSRETGVPFDKIDDETLKDASDAAKKALDIYDELMNGPKVLGDDGNTKDDSNHDEDKTTTDEWEQILKEKTEEKQDDTVPMKRPGDLPLSPLWVAYQRAESARALGLVAQCYASAGAAVTAEGLFQSSLDASSSYPFGQSLKSKEGGVGDSISCKGVSLSSPNLGLIARDVRSWYAMLCDNWEKRKGDADRLRLDALKIEREGVLRGYGRDEDGAKRNISGLESSLWLFNPLDFER